MSLCFRSFHLNGGGGGGCVAVYSGGDARDGGNEKDYGGVSGP